MDGPRERDIPRGASNKEIGTELGIAEATVKIHVQHVLRKLDVSTRVQGWYWRRVRGRTERRRRDAHPSSRL